MVGVDTVTGYVKEHSYNAWLSCIIIGGICVAVACIVSAICMYQHYRHWHCSVIQKYSIRIIVMIPVYAVDSYMSLIWKDWAFYWDVMRDTYEAYVLYCFFALLIELAGGEDNLIHELEQMPQMKFLMPFCCFHIKPGRIFLHRCRQFILQYVFVKLLLTVITFVTQVTGTYHSGVWNPKYAYLYVTIVYNISITISLYFLVQFYEATKGILKAYKPLSKFMCIKTVVFFTFWQGILVSGFSSIGLITEGESWSVEEISTFIESFLICVEMLPLAIAHMSTFGWKAFGGLIPEDGPKSDIRKGLVQSLDFRDVMYDTKSAVKLGPQRNVDLGGFMELSKLDQMNRVLKQDWLSKRGEDIVKKWKNRYFMLISRPLGLAFFKQNPFLLAEGVPFKARGFIPLSSVEEVISKDRKNDREFVIITQSRKWHILAETTEARNEWLEAIRNCQDGAPSLVMREVEDFEYVNL